MDKISKKSFPDQVAETLEAEIRNGDCHIGCRLPSESRLALSFGVSRNTIREAILTLSRKGIVETRQGSGTYVVATEARNSSIIHTLDSSSYRNVKEVRSLLECHMAERASSSRTLEDLENMREILKGDRQEESVEGKAKSDYQFHMAIAEATHNNILIGLYRSVSEYFQRFIATKLSNSSEGEDEMDNLHEELYKAIMERKSLEAKDLVSKIIEN